MNFGILDDFQDLEGLSLYFVPPLTLCRKNCIWAEEAFGVRTESKLTPNPLGKHARAQKFMGGGLG